MRCTAIGRGAGLLLISLWATACGSNSDSGAGPSSSGTGNTSGGSSNSAAGASSGGRSSGDTSSGGASSGQSGSGNDGSSGAGQAGGTAPSGTSPMLGGCAVFPANHIFNTPIDGMPTHANSKAFLDTIGAHKIHLDLGTSVDQKAADYYGIPYNIVHSKAIPWANVTFSTTDGTADEGDCAVGDAHTFTSPCTGAAAAKPQFPIPAAPLVEGGIETDQSKYGDHHVLLLDADTCGLWELYHVYSDPKGGWDIFGSAYF
ncbi:MAG TPA: hypothetical protein VIK01_16705, partial [Polyangiaceae bacterium]